MADNRNRNPGKGSSGRKKTSSGNYRKSKPGRQPQNRGRAKPGAASRATAEPGESSMQQKRRRDLKGAAVDLPNWIIEALTRVTPKDRIAPALEALGEASAAMSDGRYHAAVKHARVAKNLSPQDATIRETLGLSAYRIGDWDTALAELRAYRRMAGEATHLPIEMDVLRALDRDADVEKAWHELQKRGGHGLVMNEGIVVYASYLLDKGRADEAWKVANPGRTFDKPNEAHLRLYFVAGRAAAAIGDRSTATRLSDVIVLNDPGFPGWEQLDSEIAAIND